MALFLEDITSNNNDLTNVNTATEYTASLPFDQSSIAAEINGSTQYFTAADSASLSITGNITLETWVNFDTVPSGSAGMAFFSKFDATSDERAYLFELRDNAGTLQLRFAYSTDGTFQAANDLRVNWTPSISTWYHAAVSWTAATGVAQFVVNGSQQGADQTGTGTSISNTTSLIVLGALDSASPSAFLDGKLDDMRIYNTARSVATIGSDYVQELAGNESGLVAYWPFESELGDLGSNLMFI